MKQKHPVVIFCYNRPEKLRGLLQSCGRALHERSLYLVIDGPKNKSDEALQFCLMQVFREFTDGLSSKVLRHPANLGPRFAIPLGLKRVFSENESAIVLEEDLVVSELFFAFADKALQEVSRSSALCGFSGYMVPSVLKQHHAKQLDFRGFQKNS